MKINYNVTGAERKSLVGAISQELNAPTKYLGMPTAAYEVGEYTIDKIGTVTGPDNHELVADLQGLHSFVPVSEEYDTPLPEMPETPAFEDLQMTEEEELGLGGQRRDPMGEDGMRASDVPDGEDLDYGEAQHYPGRYADPNVPVTEEMLRQAEQWMEGQPEYSDESGLTIELPKDGFTEANISNLEKLVESKASLIKNALGADCLTIEQTEDTLRFPWFRFGISPEEINAYSRFISALCTMAKEQKRITAKEKPVDNEKYAFRCFLLRLGFIGEDCKAERKILLSKLSGNGSFKSGERKPTIGADAESEVAANG